MPTKIVDLSDLLSDPIEVRFEKDGPTYLLPGDIDAPLWLRIQQLGGDETLTVQTIEELAERVLGLFRVHQPEMEELSLSLTQLVAVIGRVYLGVEATDPPKAPARRKTGTASMSRTRKSA